MAVFVVAAIFNKTVIISQEEGGQEWGRSQVYILIN